MYNKKVHHELPATVALIEQTGLQKRTMYMRVSNTRTPVPTNTQGGDISFLVVGPVPPTHVLSLVPKIDIIIAHKFKSTKEKNAYEQQPSSIS